MTTAPDIAIDVEGLTKSFDGRKAVRNLSMCVKRGQIYGFLGPNGSGKTTTIRMLCGLLTPDEGRGTCLGYDIRREADEIKRHVGYMTQRFSLYQDPTAPRSSGGFWRRTWAMLIKEFIQLKRDRVSFAMIVMIPLVQLLLFGYAINTNPRHLPTAVLLQEQSDLGRSILRAIENTKYFDVTHVVQSEAEFDRLLASGTVLFAIEIPANFERALRRGDRPALLVAADATDPVAAGSAMAALGTLVQTALRHDRAIPEGATPPFEIRTHARYNPAATTSLNIVPGLVGTILTMTMLIFTALSVTREIERGTMENLLSMPITPIEIMLGKIVPYIIVGFVQASMIIG